MDSGARLEHCFPVGAFSCCFLLLCFFFSGRLQIFFSWGESFSDIYLLNLIQEKLFLVFLPRREVPAADGDERRTSLERRNTNLYLKISTLETKKIHNSVYFIHTFRSFYGNLVFLLKTQHVLSLGDHLPDGSHGEP